MTSLWVLVLLVTCAHYVTALGTPCPAEDKINSTSANCEKDENCSDDLICCPYSGGKKCADLVLPNFQATMYILDLPRITDEITPLTNYINETFGNVSTLRNLEVKRLGQCVELFIGLHTELEQETEVEAILANMEDHPVNIDTFSGGPFLATSVRNESVCKEDVVIPNFNAMVYVVGVPPSVTPEMIKSKMLGVMKDVGHSWAFASRKIGGCLQVQLDGVVPLEDEAKVSELLDTMEEEGLTMRPDGSYLRVVTNKQDAAVCPTLKVNDTMPIAIPNFQARLIILNVVGVVTSEQVEDALLQTVKPYGFKWQIMNRTTGGCMEVFMEGVVKEENENDLVIALDNLEVRGLAVTSANHVFNVTTQKKDMATMCKKVMKPSNDTRIQVNVTLTARWEEYYADVNYPVMQALVVEMKPLFEMMKGFKQLVILYAWSGSVRVVMEASFSQNVSLTDLQKMMTSARNEQILFDGEERGISNITLVTSDRCGQEGCGNGSCAKSTTGAKCICPKDAYGDRCQHSGLVTVFISRLINLMRSSGDLMQSTGDHQCA